MTAKGRTTSQLAVRLDTSEHRVRELLLECQELGLAEPSPHGWGLTPAAELAYGWAFRSLDVELVDAGGSFASRSPTSDGLDAEAA